MWTPARSGCYRVGCAGRGLRYIYRENLVEWLTIAICTYNAYSYLYCSIPLYSCDTLFRYTRMLMRCLVKHRQSRAAKTNRIFFVYSKQCTIFINNNIPLSIHSYMSHRLAKRNKLENMEMPSASAMLPLVATYL